MKHSFTHTTRILFAREMFAIWTTPSIWTIIIAYLSLGALLTLTIGGFIDANKAELNGFLAWQPWLFMLCCPAIASALWRPEFSNGCDELLHSWPISPLTPLYAKFTASFAFVGIALLLTFPFPLCCLFLGNPDGGAMLAGYVGCFSSALLFTAISNFSAVAARRQFGSYLTSLLLGFFLLLPGYRPFNILLLKWGASAHWLDTIASFSLFRHLEAPFCGVLLLGDILYFIFLSCAFLLAAGLVCQIRHARIVIRKKFYYASAISLFICAALLTPTMTSMQLDLTGDHAYTLHENSQAILQTIKPTTITVFYSSSVAEIPEKVRTRAARIALLLRQIVHSANGKIVIRNIDPCTEEEQQATEAKGLSPRITAMGELWFHGASIEADGKQMQILPNFDDMDEYAIEYNLINAIQNAQYPARPVIGVISSLPVFEHIQADTKKYTPDWWVIRQLSAQYELKPIAPTDTELPNNLQCILLIHPIQLSPSLIQDIRQYLEHGGHGVFCLDPLSKVAESDQKIYQIARPSYCNEILADFGIALYGNRVIADRRLSTAMTDATRGIEQIPTLLTLSSAQCSKNSFFSSSLRQLNLFCAGALKITDQSRAKITVLCSTTEDTQLLPIYAARRTPADILKVFKPDGKTYPICLVAERPSYGKIAVIADADFLHNSLCINTTTQNDGSVKENAINDNATLLFNILDDFVGKQNIAQLRGRGNTSRTFSYIDAFAKKTEKQVMSYDIDAAKERQELAKRLKELEDKARQTPSQALNIQMELIRKQQSSLETSVKIKQREALKQLRKRIDRIERYIALSTILAIPTMLVVLALIVTWKRRR